MAGMRRLGVRIVGGKMKQFWLLLREWSTHWRKACTYNHEEDHLSVEHVKLERR
jgi:hypothetical protein